MSELEKEAIQYAEDTCDSCHGDIDLNMMRDYAKTDFISGAEWYKEKSKAPEMLELLMTIENDSNHVPKWLWDKIQTLIKEATEL
jgi:hypothetical protein